MVQKIGWNMPTIAATPSFGATDLMDSDNFEVWIVTITVFFKVH